ncbi:MAG: response regulator transcription factor [Williamsia sp.]|nr:response regulator transcription factor [Williamsia sp.]
MEEKISVVIADDHPAYLEGLKMMLRREKNIHLIGEAEDGLQLLGLLTQVQPDVIVLDIHMPNMGGIEAIKHVARLYPYIRMLALTMDNYDYMVVDVLEAGAMGYLLKNAGKDEILEAIETVYHHQPYYSRTISFDTIRRISASGFNPHKNTKLVLSETEKQIIHCICKELTSKEIAAELHLSIHTVDSYRKDISRKIGAKSMAGVVIFAIKKGIYKIV